MVNNFIKEINGGLCAVDNVETYGIKEGKYGVSIIVNKGCNASAVYTSNQVVAAPIIYDKQILDNGKVSAVFINSGNANCFTGKQGIKDCETIGEFVSNKLNVPIDEVFISSTGVIGRQMQMDIFTNLASKVISKIEHSSEASHNCAKSIMTTDTIPKEIAVEVRLQSGEKVKIGGVCKGSGMIAPNMGTMLAFFVTDAKMTSDEINQALKLAVDDSFNMVVVDGDESTNDTALLMANGSSNVSVSNNGSIDENFQEGLNYICKELAKLMASDGEGASKLIEANVFGAKSVEDAKKIAKSIISSPLFKSAVFGGDPNWGRIVSAAGYAGVDFDPNNVIITLRSDDDSAELVNNGEIFAFEGTETLNVAEKIMNNDKIIVDFDLNSGDSVATAWGCDLTYDYVKINAEYTT